MKPLVSILIPAHNAEPWVAQTIQSALEQTWDRTEIIVVDDGSTDRTHSIARQFASKRVSVISQAKQGASAARNKALSLSQGDYIQWLDADDLLDPQKIARQMTAIEASPDKRLLLSSAWAHFLYRARKARFQPSPLWADLTPLEWLLRKMEHNAHMQPATWLVSRQITEATGPWDTRLTLDDDGEYFCRVLLASSGTRFVEGARTFYRVTGSGSLSYVGTSAEKLDSQFQSCRLHVEYVLRLSDDARSRAACLRYLQKYVPFFHFHRPDLIDGLARIAASLDGRLESPRLSWKYDWIHRAFGWSAATASQRRYNKFKWSAAINWDRTLLKVEGAVSRLRL